MPLRFKESYQTNQSSTFKTSIKENEKSSRFKNYPRFRGFALHYESEKSPESSENVVLLPYKKRLDYFLTVLKLALNVQDSRKLNKASFLLETGVTWYNNWMKLVNSCCIASQTFIVSYLTFQSSNFKTLIKKNEKSSTFKNFHQFRGFYLHYEKTLKY